VPDDRPALRAGTVDARRDIRRWNGLGRSGLRPTAFNWPVFGAALLLMATPLAHAGWRSLSSYEK